MKRAASFVLIFLLVGLLVAMFQVNPAEAGGTIYIRVDGSIDPPSAPIVREGTTYLLADDINGSLVVEKNGITIDGAGFTLRGDGTGTGISLYGRGNVTAHNLRVDAFDYGIYLQNSSNNVFFGDSMANSDYGVVVLYSSSNNSFAKSNIANNDYGIWLSASSNCNSISGNNITANEWRGIRLESSNNTISENNITANGQYGIGIAYSSSYNTISGNRITANGDYGIRLDSSPNNSISDNNITNNYYGILLSNSSSNDIHGNKITGSGVGVHLASSYGNLLSENAVTGVGYGFYLTLSSGNIFFHNNLVENTHQVITDASGANVWDYGYPSGGNYWSNHNGTDLFSGPYQDQTGSDGIGDTPYIIDIYNMDNYPLMGTLGPLTPPGDDIVVFPADDVCVIYETVTYGGLTAVKKPSTGPAPPPGFSLERYYVIETTAEYTGNISIRIVYNMSMGTRSDATLEESWQLLQCVMLAGDVDEDFNVDIFDIVLLAGAYGTSPPNPKYSPECDIDCDGDVDIFDLVRAAANYGEVWDPATGWSDITTRVDEENNSIFGVTQHLSIFGVTRRS